MPHNSVKQIGQILYFSTQKYSILNRPERFVRQIIPSRPLIEEIKDKNG